MWDDLIKLWRFLSFIARLGSCMRESKARHAQIKLILFMNFNHAGDHLQQSGHVTHRDIFMCMHKVQAGRIFC